MQSDTPIELLVSREWNGTKWHYPNIERMVEETKRLRAELAAMRQQRDEAVRALKEIAHQDYRGHPSTESQIAMNALAAMRKGATDGK